MMKITRLKLVNHVRFKNIELDLGTPEIISILGVNGSGKSFLINCFHPFSGDNRFHKTYSFIEGETGYKEIEYLTNDGERYICKHEYIPKGKSHSCKSYIDLITPDGTKVELNPTGHNEFFKEAVKKYLHFDMNTFEVGMISFESRGITGTSVSNRKKVLETTVNLDAMNRYKKNSINLSKEYSSYSKLTFKDRANILNSCSLTDLKQDIEKLVSSINDNQIKQRELTELKAKLTKEYEDVVKLESFDNTDVLIKASKYYAKYPDDKRTLIDIIHERNNANLSADIISTNISNHQIELNHINEIKFNKETYLSQKQELDNKTLELSRFKSNLLSKVDYSKFDSDVVSQIKVLIYHLKSIDKSLNVKSLNDATERLNSLNEIITRLTDLEQKFLACKDICGENKYEAKKHDVCKECDLNNYYGEASEFIKNHEDEYNRFKKNSESMYEEKSSLISAIAAIQKIDVTPLNIISEFKDITIDKLLELHASSDLITKVNDMILEFNYQINIIKTLEENVKDAESNCDRLSKMIETEPSEDVVKELTTQLVELRESLEKTETNIKGLNNIITFIGCDAIPNSSKVLFMSGDEIVSTAQKIQKINSEKTRIESELVKVNSQLINISNEITSQIELKLSYENKINRHNELDAKYNEFSRSAEILTRCRNLLEKDIPILLMRDNLDFIEGTVNAMLAENNIDITINIIPSDTEVIISAVAGNYDIDDISQLSAGEKCLISLLLNATVLHLLGYGVMCLDEIDANLSINNTAKFSSIIYNIMSRLDISQIICISHSVNSRIAESTRIVVGDASELDLTDTSNMIQIGG